MSEQQGAQRSQSQGEEIANSISHGVALLSAIVAAPFLILAAVQKGSAAGIVGVSIFAAAMVVLYLMSTLYHAMPRGGAKDTFQVLDHMAIYLLIAATYTPFALGVLQGTWGWMLFGLVWGMAFAGILLKAIVGVRHMLLSTGLYVVMGWMGIVVIRPLWSTMPGAGFWWLIAGGIVYTAGVAFFLIDHKVRYGHFIWHLFVTGGSACHFVAVLICTR
ncbi:MAG: hemolysin III family protein [Planctomycetota bacterium]|nr:hemolysin III family protein [Planctomycetota bacterium]